MKFPNNLDIFWFGKYSVLFRSFSLNPVRSPIQIYTSLHIPSIFLNFISEKSLIYIDNDDNLWMKFQFIHYLNYFWTDITQSFLNNCRESRVKVLPFIDPIKQLTLKYSRFGFIWSGFQRKKIKFFPDL